MRETSYHAVIAEMTVRALWELQNLLDCIPDALWDRCYGGAPLWQHVYHTLHELDQWFINPRDTDFVEPPIHTPHLQELHIYPAVRLDRPAASASAPLPPTGRTMFCSVRSSPTLWAACWRASVLLAGCTA